MNRFEIGVVHGDRKLHEGGVAVFEGGAVGIEKRHADVAVGQLGGDVHPMEPGHDGIFRVFLTVEVKPVVEDRQPLGLRWGRTG